eukprot:CAMPEP_0181306974 /NCGR_PEP_ID=MMETSP1101-20121128/10603_1 /TAXON_ID=46948 /ORGANISM="Rhodomonas abbreviata, Strain Caron Lab Isolate" /LENGTH=400 /DNA_ID=CAMNT_0023413101 /DNA_START=18 /DNA_END=1223 /DNA_ORIENTATION=+
MSTAVGSRRPAESAFKQQKLKAWQPILSPKWVIGSFLLVGAVFIPIGVAVLIASGQVLDLSLRYDEDCREFLNEFGSDKAPTTCQIPFDVPDNDGWETKDVFVYYQLDNFYQNHRRYVQSRSAKQLNGDTLSLDATDALTSDSSVAECKPFFDSGIDTTDDQEVFYYPCGLVARSLFNDTLKIREQDTGDYVMFNDANTLCGLTDEPCPSNADGIAWASDVDKKYKAPGVEWIAKNCKYLGGNNLETSGWIDPAVLALVEDTPVTDCGLEVCGHRVLDGGAPNKGIYNCWHNVSDQDLVVWMRIAALPSFKKLYRKIPAGALKKNTAYNLEVSNNFPVHQFGGKKTVVLSTTSWIGGQNDFLGFSYVVVGGICVALSLVFLGKNMVSPRIMGDPRYLQWK